RFLLLSGAFAGLAFLSKYPALFIGAFIALVMLIAYFLRHDSSLGVAPESFFARAKAALTTWLPDIVLWSVAAGVVFVLVWPAMWVNPLGPITEIINDALRASGSTHQKGSYFLGEPVADPGTFFYPLVILLRTTPVIFFGVLVALWLLIRGKLSDSTQSLDRTTYYTIFGSLFAYILLYGLLVTYGGKKQDRYILPAFPALSMMATFGYLQIVRIFTARSSSSQSSTAMSRFRHAQWALPVALVVIQLLLILPSYPYYFSYYNRFASGGSATDTIQVGWGEGLNEAADYLNSLPDAETIEVVSWYSTTFEPFFDGNAIYKIEDEKISRSAKPGLAADYVVFYVNQVQRQLPTEGALQFFRSTEPAYTVRLGNLDYAWIYPSVSVDYVIPVDARLIGQGELLGYDLTDEAGNPVTTAYPESVVLLSLYWEWQGKVEEEPIQISLVDDAGNTRGWGNFIQSEAPLPYAEWQEGMIVREEFALVIFPDTEPGTYQLSGRTAWKAATTTSPTGRPRPTSDP
ncbi:MAG: hypothetical protein AAF485_32920, partial [Chloroflexota bacterium]